jgi:hypothetical protein
MAMGTYNVTIKVADKEGEYRRTLRAYERAQIDLSYGDLVVSDLNGMVDIYARGEWCKVERVDED